MADIDSRVEQEKIKNEINSIDVPEMEATNEEKSAFFEQWKAKHEAFLANQHEIDSLHSETDVEKLDKTPLFQGIQKAKKKKKPKGTASDSSVKRPRFTVPSKVLWRSAPILATSILMAALALYFISPMSKNKYLSVSGNNQLSVEQVEKFSNISQKDYILTIFLNASAYAENIKKSSPAVESATIHFKFPSSFEITIKEFPIIGYLAKDSQLYSVLSNGAVMSEPVVAEALPANYTTINLSDQEMVKKLAIELGKIDESVRTVIQSIDLTPSSVTADLMTMKMVDGNTVIVPLSELSQKMKYYSKIALEVTVPTTIDMEVGIYRYAS
ncbi:TPA: FtsQ-type POTRA domain-containing protein [Streptococcus suis]|nr:FtsQ-type POTRA domain-containing protein [Streptococcus suis]HEM6266072.1 FtsQ-type POTRA domain-containing protein [Streptococcus suis]